MADKKISQLTAASTPLAGTEVLPIVQSGNTVKVSSDDLTVKNVRSNATSGILQVAGPGAGATRTMTTPDANFTVARTDAANTFTGNQTLADGILTVKYGTNAQTLAPFVLSTTDSTDQMQLSVNRVGTTEFQIQAVHQGNDYRRVTINPDGGDFKVKADRLYVNATGVGCGTNNPLLPLHVVTTGTGTNMGDNASTTLRSGAAGRASTLQFSDGTTAAWISALNGAIGFGPGGTEAFRATTDGNLAISTAGKGIEYSTTAGFYESSGGWSFKLNGTADTIKFTAAGNIECIRRTNSNAAFQVVTTNSNNAGWNAAGAVQLVSNDLSTGRSINCTGTVNQNGADYAEYMTKSGDFEIAKGDVCGVDSNGKLTKTFSEAITFVVKSTDPGLVGGDQWGVGLADDPVALEEERKKVDRIAFCGQVPVNVLNAQPGQYIVPVDDNGVIKGQAVSDPTFEQYRVAVGKVIAIEADGRAKIIVKIS